VGDTYHTYFTSCCHSDFEFRSSDLKLITFIVESDQDQFYNTGTLINNYNTRKCDDQSAATAYRPAGTVTKNIEML
jgi:hypothetical protein